MHLPHYGHHYGLPMIKTNLLFLLVLVSFPSAAELSWRADVTYTEANPDFSAFSNGEGYSIYAEVLHEAGVFGALRHTDAEFQPSGPVSGGEVSTWQSVALGYRHDLDEHWLLEGRVSFQENERELSGGKDKESGHAIELGAGFKVFDPLSVRLNVGTLDLLIDDWTLRAELEYSFSENIYAIARLRDYADWDFTYYEAGLGIKF